MPLLLFDLFSFKNSSVFKNSAYCVVYMSETELNPKEKVQRV